MRPATPAAEVAISLKVAVLGSGSSGNCTFVGNGRVRVLIDAGFSAREIAARLAAIGESADGLDALVLTHEHIDHVRGVERFARRHRVPVFSTRPSWEASGLSSDRLSSADQLHWFEPGAALDFGPIRLRSFALSHDSAACVGFRVECEGAALGHATDFGESTTEVEENLFGCDMLVLESNHDVDMLRVGPYPWALKKRISSPGGHLSNDACARLLARVTAERTRRVVLAHLSETNNHPEIALLTTRAAFGRLGAEPPAVAAARQDRPAEVVHL